jgi:hypothetical protein
MPRQIREARSREGRSGRPSGWAAAVCAAALAGCTHVGSPGSTCYDGMFTSYCVVPVPAGSAIAPGTGIMPATGAMLLGTGAAVGGASVVGALPDLMHAETAVENGVAALSHGP